MTEKHLVIPTSTLPEPPTETLGIGNLLLWHLIKSTDTALLKCETPTPLYNAPAAVRATVTGPTPTVHPKLKLHAPVRSWPWIFVSSLCGFVFVSSVPGLGFCISFVWFCLLLAWVSITAVTTMKEKHLAIPTTTLQYSRTTYGNAVRWESCPGETNCQNQTRIAIGAGNLESAATPRISPNTFINDQRTATNAATHTKGRRGKLYM